MTSIHLPGLDGSNPLGFLASLGLLRVLSRETESTRLGFLDDGSCRAFVDGFSDSDDVVAAIVRDAQTAVGTQPWKLSYEKQEKNGVKRVADLKAPPEVFEDYLRIGIQQWRSGNDEAVAYAAAYGTSIARDGKDKTKPTAFHFTAANQEFLKTVEESRSHVDVEWTRKSLLTGYAARPGSNLRWDPAAERNWALMANNPNDEGTSVDAPLEWLAFRALPLFPTFPKNSGVRPRVITTAVTGRGDEMRFVWPLWTVPVSLSTVSSLVRIEWKKIDLRDKAQGVFAICRSEIRRTSQGFGNFGPAIVES
jgi:hypothetical protein